MFRGRLFSHCSFLSVPESPWLRNRGFLLCLSGLNRPSCRNAVDACCRPRCGRVLHKRTARRDTRHPVLRIICSGGRGEHRLDVGKVCAAVEHAAVTTVTVAPQRGCRKFGSRGQARATVKHAVVARGRQRGCRKGWSCCEACATTEHAVVASSSKRGCRKFGSRGQARATTEHANVAKVR